MRATDDKTRLTHLIYRQAEHSEVEDDDQLARAVQDLKQSIDQLVDLLAKGEPLPEVDDDSWTPPK